MRTIYISLDENDFATLVQGKELIRKIEQHSVHLVLQDIGFWKMKLEIDKAQSKRT